MISKKFTLLAMSALLSSLLSPLSPVIQAVSASEYKIYAQTENRPPVVVLKAHTGARYPAVVNMVVGQKLAFKGNGPLDLMTLRYHQIILNHDPMGKDPLQEVSNSRYKGEFLAVAPGETKLNIDSNGLFYSLFPWTSHSVRVRVYSAQTDDSIAQRPEQIQ